MRKMERAMKHSTVPRYGFPFCSLNFWRLPVLALTQWALRQEDLLSSLLMLFFGYFICMGYWPSVRSRWLDIGQVLFLRVHGPRRSRGPYTRKKRTRPISSHLDRTNLVNKGFIIWLLAKFCSRDAAGSPERARWLHLARSGSQSQRAIWFILPAHGASHIISYTYWLNEVSRIQQFRSNVRVHGSHVLRTGVSSCEIHTCAS